MKGINQNAETSLNIVAKNVLAQYGLVAARYIFPLITLPFLARVFSVETYGVRAYVISIMLFFQVILDFGFTLYGTKKVIEAAKSTDEINRVFSGILYGRLFLIFFCSLILIPIIQSIPLLRDNIFITILGYAAIAINMLAPDFIFMAKQDMKIITTRFVVSRIISTALIFLIVKNSDDIILVFSFELLASIVSFLMTWLSAVRKFNLRLKKVGVNYIRKTIIGSFPYFMSNLSIAALNSTAIILVGITLDAEKVAYWSLSVTALNAILSLYNPIANSLYPHVVAAKSFQLLRRVLIVSIPVLLVLIIVWYISSDFIMVLLGGSQYSKQGYILKLLSPVLFFAFPALMLGNPLLGAAGLTRQLMITSIVSVCFFLIVCFVLISLSSFSIASVAVARSATEFILFIIRIFSGRIYLLDNAKK